MGKFIDLTGKTFERLRVLHKDDAPQTGRYRTRWVCECACGNIVSVDAYNLAHGKSKSCGCLQREASIEANRSHGGTDERLYAVWCSMKNRCYNENVPAYHRYGGRGITVCDQWRESYAAFKEWALATGYLPDAPRGVCTLDRIDNSGNYEPGNCRWISQREQMSNVSYNHLVKYDGKQWTIAELAHHFNIPYTKLYQRIALYGYSVEDAIHKK